MIKTTNRLLLMLAATGLVVAATAQHRPVLIVHDEVGPMQSLSEGLANWHGIESELVDQQDFTQVGDRLAVMMYVHKPLLERVETALIDYAERGGRLVILHHGIASAKLQNPRWLDLLGVQIQPRDDPQYPWKVLRGDYQLVNLAPQHFVTSNHVSYPATTAYTPSDSPSTEQTRTALVLPDTEIFLNHIFRDGREKTVLFGFRVEADGSVYMQDRAGWLKKTGKGTTFYFQPGHFAKDYTRDYVQILANAIRWNGE